jgi:hypothetical protein
VHWLAETVTPLVERCHHQDFVPDNHPASEVLPSAVSPQVLSTHQDHPMATSFVQENFVLLQ